MARQDGSRLARDRGSLAERCLRPGRNRRDSRSLVTVVDAGVWLSYRLPDDVNHAESRAWFEQLGSTEELLVPMLLLVEAQPGSRVVLGNSIASSVLSPSFERSPDRSFGRWMTSLW